jgi:sulfur-carrier protein
VSVTVRYWAAARAAAGRVEDTVSGSTVSEVLAAARSLHADNPRFAQVLGISSLLLGDQPISSSDVGAVAVSPGDVIEVLPPFAGG